MHENEVSKWKEDGNVFLETPNFPNMLEQVKKTIICNVCWCSGLRKNSHCPPHCTYTSERRV